MPTFSALDPVVILSYARTPMGGMQGDLSEVPATELGAIAVKGAVERSGVAGAAIERIYMGCVLLRRIWARPRPGRPRFKAGLPKSVEATTVNKMCGSGMQAVIMGAEALLPVPVDYIVAGGMESMTNAPYLLKKHPAARASATTPPMTTCSSTGWKTPMNPAGRWAALPR
jgi:acetyl-CoA C-acetyltransferase